MTRRVAACGALGALLVATGCAGLMPPAGPRPGAPAGSAPGAAAGRHAPATAPATVDSSPSRDALAVLATLPEPLPESERVPPPGAAAAPAPLRSDSAGEAGATGGGGAGSDSAAEATADTATADTARAGVPVPEPTVPLGEGTAGAALPESALVPRVPPARPKAAEPDSCWRIQVGAPREQAKAQTRREAAASQLLVPFVVEREKGRYKVRSRDCMDRATAAALKARARRSGFSGVYLIVAPRKP